MSILIPRNRASTVTYTESEATELQGQLEKLPFSLTTADRPQWLQQLHAPIEASQTICQLFRANASPNRIRDAFRHLNGFQILIEALRSTSQSIRLSQITKSEVEAILDVYQNLWALLTAALQDHWGNRKYFRKRVEGGGWETLQQILKEMLRDHTFEYLRQVTERLFGCLFACALEDETLNRLFSQLARHREDDNGGKIEHSTHKPADPELGKEEREGDRDDIGFIKQALGTQAFLHNPEAVAIATQLWLLEWSEPADECHVATAVSLVLPAVIDRIADIKTHNLVALHAAGVLKLILHAFVNCPLNENQQRQLRDLATVLLTLGVTDLNDAHFLYRHASTSKEVAELLQIAFQKSSIPPCIHFDLSTHGFASVELSDIGRTFPPVNSSSGYTLSMWLQVVDFDPESHTTLFGAFDSSQSCFVLIYLEKDTRNLILQTSVTASRPSVRFKSFVFDAGRWYHLCVVHRRPKTTTSSRASLFIDGEFVEQVKAQYPAPPPLALTLADNADVLSPGRKHRPVQAFLGTPQDLASRIGQGLVSSRWRLASAYLFNDTLSDDLIAVHMQLGPRYHGNYQDCLGSFQTYRASAALNLRNESLHPGREDKSEIVTAIRSKASALLPESRVILNFSPMMVLDDDDRNNVDETQLIKSLSKNAAKNMRTVTRNGRNAIIINGAIPSVNEALTHSYGFAVLTGEPVIVIPQSLDDASWRIGGCAPVGLALVESASSPQNLICALEILLGTIQDSWRNSEAMERENGFGVLASLLTAKLDNIHTGLKMQNLHINVTETEAEALSFEILSIILKFIGYQERSLADSVINNPLAYRILIVDLDIWRTSSPKVQKLYYEQFETFSTGSKHHHFNTKRLGRMR